MNQMQSWILVRLRAVDAERTALSRIIQHRGDIIAQIAAIEQEQRARDARANTHTRVVGQDLVDAQLYRETSRTEIDQLRERLMLAEQAAQGQIERVQNAQRQYEAVLNLAKDQERQVLYEQARRDEQSLHDQMSRKGKGGPQKLWPST